MNNIIPEMQSDRIVYKTWQNLAGTGNKKVGLVGLVGC